MIQTSAPSQQQVSGFLRLHFSQKDDGTGTYLSLREQRPPLKVVRAFPQEDGGTLVHLHNISGGLLGGDQLENHITVQPGAIAQLTTTSATRVYRCRPEATPTVQKTRVQIEAGGLLEYLPDPLIPFAGARYRQQTQVVLAEQAGLFWWETLAPGRVAHGEVFAYDQLDLEMTIQTAQRPLLIERTRLHAPLPDLTSPAHLGPYRYLTSFYMCRVGWKEWLQLEQELSALANTLSIEGEIVWGVSTLVAHGLLVRGLSRTGRELAGGLTHFWQAAKRRVYGKEAYPPRKVY